MTKFDLVERIAGKTGITKKDVALVVDGFLEEIKVSLLEGQYIELRGFGSFMVKVRKPRIAWNPKTGDKIHIGEKRIPYFKPGTILKKAVLHSAVQSSEAVSLKSEPVDDKIN